MVCAAAGALACACGVAVCGCVCAAVCVRLCVIVVECRAAMDIDAAVDASCLYVLSPPFLFTLFFLRLFLSGVLAVSANASST